MFIESWLGNCKTVNKNKNIFIEIKSFSFFWNNNNSKSTDNSSPQLGSDLYSWAYDGCTSGNLYIFFIFLRIAPKIDFFFFFLVYYNNQRQHYGSGDVRRGDIIGVGVDFDRRCMQFWKNGEWFSEMFQHFQKKYWNDLCFYKGRSLGPIFHGFHADGGLIPTCN